MDDIPEKYPGNAAIYRILWEEEPEGGFKKSGNTPLVGRWRCRSPGITQYGRGETPEEALGMMRQIVEERMRHGDPTDK